MLQHAMQWDDWVYFGGVDWKHLLQTLWKHNFTLRQDTSSGWFYCPYIHHTISGCTFSQSWSDAICDNLFVHHSVIFRTKTKKREKQNMDLDRFPASTGLSIMSNWCDHLSTHWPKMLSDPNEGSFLSRPCCPLGSVLHCPGERQRLHE